MKPLWFSRTRPPKSLKRAIYGRKLRRKMMKKMVRTAILVIVMICLFTGLASAGSIMDRILKNGKLVVGITGTQPPLNVTTKDGKIIGFDADIANAISANLGVDLKLPKCRLPSFCRHFRMERSI